MANKPIVEIEGAARLRKTLRDAGDDLTDLKAANRAAAETAAGGATAVAPRLSGLLAGDIRAAGTKTAGIIRAGRKKIPYAGPIHWGWPARGITGRPFLSQGAQQTEPAWLPIYTEQLDQILASVKGK